MINYEIILILVSTNQPLTKKLVNKLFNSINQSDAYGAWIGKDLVRFYGTKLDKDILMNNTNPMLIYYMLIDNRLVKLVSDDQLNKMIVGKWGQVEIINRGMVDRLSGTAIQVLVDYFIGGRYCNTLGNMYLQTKNKNTKRYIIEKVDEHWTTGECANKPIREIVYRYINREND